MKNKIIAVSLLFFSLGCSNGKEEDIKYIQQNFSRQIARLMELSENFQAFYDKGNWNTDADKKLFKTKEILSVSVVCKRKEKSSGISITHVDIPTMTTIGNKNETYPKVNYGTATTAKDRKFEIAVYEARTFEKSFGDEVIYNIVFNRKELRK